LSPRFAEARLFIGKKLMAVLDWPLMIL